MVAISNFITHRQTNRRAKFSLAHTHAHTHRVKRLCFVTIAGVLLCPSCENRAFPLLRRERAREFYALDARELWQTYERWDARMTLCGNSSTERKLSGCIICLVIWIIYIEKYLPAFTLNLIGAHRFRSPPPSGNETRITDRV